jgi:ABC-2 type transport system permease protein
MAGLGSALLVLLVPAAVLGSATLVLASDDRSIGRMGVLIGVYLLYFIIWLGVSLAVSARARSGRTALVTLLGLWMASGLLAPRAATELARWLHPTPSLLEFQATMARERESGLDGQSSPEQRERELRARVLAQYRVDSLSQLPVSFAGLALDAGETWGDQVYDRNYGKLWDTFEAQERVRAAVGAVFPLLAVRALSQSLAGTDFVQHRRFATAAEQYRRMLVTRMNHEMTEKAKGLDFEYRASDSLWASVPAFAYEEPGLLWVLRRQVASLVIIALWAAAAVGFATAVASRIRGVETDAGAI